MDRFAKAEEEAIGTRGSSCNYPTVHVQVLSFRQQTIDTAHKAGKLEPVSGVGDEHTFTTTKNGSLSCIPGSARTC